MESITAKLGIDASKNHLDIRIEGPQGSKRMRITNCKSGFAKLHKEIAGQHCLVAIEASGRYETAVRRSLEAAGHEVRLQNPRHVRRLAEGMGIDAKTDRLDADVLVRTIDLCPSNEPRSAEREALGDLERTIAAYKAELMGHRKRLQVPGLSSAVVQSEKRLIRALEKEIEKLEKEFIKQVKASSLATKYELVQTIPGVGPGLARSVVCELAEDLVRWNPRQIASYANLAPNDDSSGKRQSVSRIGKRGNMHLKAALYMPAMTLVRREEWARSTYQRLRGRGLAHQQAMVPIMRKLLLQVAAVMKRETPWEGVPPSKT